MQDRQVHVDVSVSLDGHILNRLTAQDLQPIYERKLNHLLIQGEGGSGKTSLACQIGQWAMATSPAERVARQIMLPILIEDDFEADDQIDDPFIVTIQRRLQLLVDEENPIDSDMLRELLLQRRLLVIVDHFSEMSEATRRLIRPDQSEFLANAMVITSRLAEEFGALTPVVVKPLRFSGSRLSSFVDAYLTMRRKRDLIEDTEFFDGCKKLSAMVGTREITVLLAKLYAEQMIGAKQKAQDSELPETIPGLMISYLNELNRNLTEHRIPDRALHKAAKTAAWACVRESFRPMPTSRQGLVEALGGDQALLDYLEHRLHLMRTIPPAKEQVRFLLDPLAEYLAALHLVDLYGADAEAWRRLLVYAKVMPGGPDPIRSFLLAVRDCCLARGDAGPIPASVPGELWRLAGLRPVRRKLAAILAADMVGYSRLMGEDEETTLGDLNSARRLILEQVASHQGRVFSGSGDSVIAEFASAVDAVWCALRIQQGLERRGSDKLEDRRTRFRIGVNLGDVIVQDDDLHGDGVNIAVRLESSAKPGGICVSGSVYDQVRNKIEANFEYLGEQHFKTIVNPIRTYRVIPSGDGDEALEFDLPRQDAVL